MLNSFIEKGAKQYHAEIKKAKRLLNEKHTRDGSFCVTIFDETSNVEVP